MHARRALSRSMPNTDLPLPSPLLLHGIHGLLHSRRPDAAAHGFQNCALLHDSAATAYCRPGAIDPRSDLVPSSTPACVVRSLPISPTPLVYSTACGTCAGPTTQSTRWGALLSAPASTVRHVLRAPPARGCASSTLF